MTSARVDAQVASSVPEHIRLLRPTAALGSAATALVGAVVGNGVGMNAVWAACVTGSAVAAANGFNDLVDEAADRVNQPHRPLPSGKVSPESVRRVVAGCAAASLAAAILLGPWFVAWAAVSLVAGGLYSTWFQRLPGIGNLVVAALIANALLFGAAASGDLSDWALVGALEVFLFTLSREILKDAPDVAGDRLHGTSTIAGLMGQRAAAQLCVVGSIALGVAAVIATILLALSWLHAAVLVLATALPLGLMASRVSANTPPDEIIRYLDQSRLLWVSGLVGIALLAL